MNGSATQSSTLPGLFRGGIGVGFDFEYRTTMGELNGDSTDQRPGFVVGVKNFGVYFASTSNTTTRIDTNYSYTGLEINKISDISNSVVNGVISLDSLQNNKSNDRAINFLPFEIYFYKSVIPDKKIQPVYGFRYLILSNYRAYFYLGACYYSTKNFSATTYLSYGGYGMLQWGLNIGKDYKRFTLGLGCNNILGMFSKHQMGKAGVISLKYKI